MTSESSGIPAGMFPPGAQLPWDHPDWMRIHCALEGLPPDTTPTFLDVGAEGLSDADWDAAICEEEAQIAAFPGGRAAWEKDLALKSFLANALSVWRASGTLSDQLFDEIVAMISTPKGRERAVAGFNT